MESLEGTVLVRTFHHDITSVDVISDIVGRCELNKDYKVIQGRKLRVNKRCGANFTVCHKVGRQTPTPSPATPSNKFTLIITLLPS